MYQHVIQHYVKDTEKKVSKTVDYAKIKLFCKIVKSIFSLRWL